jgi:trk system potassium uptake protein TrkH
MNKKYLKLSIPQIILLGYLTLIIVGSILLWLPFAHKVPIKYIDALFTAVSATCVTGLITVDTANTWTIFGQTIIILLIQVGGLGVLAFITLLQLGFRRRITIRQRLAIQQDLNSFDMYQPERLIRKVVLISLGIELAGALLLSVQFVPEYGLVRGVAYGIFHAISAFCNAGFDLFGNFQSVIPYQTNPFVLGTLSLLIIAGGLGFIVWSDVTTFFMRKGKHKLSFHTKIVLVTTGLLLLTSIVLIGLLEYNNGTLAGLSLGDKIQNIIFLAVSPRTAGFSNVPLVNLRLATMVLTVVLMFIGASSGSTAGGIKTTTFAVIMLTLYSRLRQRSSVRVFGRRISTQSIDASFTVATSAFLLILVSTFILTITDPAFGLIASLFETVSAFGTVGSSLGMTTELSLIGKVIIMILMYVGRVGPITFGLSLLEEKTASVTYPEGKVLIG